MTGPGYCLQQQFRCLFTKARFSKRADAVSDDEDAGSGQKGQDDVAEPVLAPIESFVGQQPSAVVLNHAADPAQPRAVRFADLTNVGLDALVQAEPAVVGAVVAGIGVQLGDSGADSQGQMKRMREKPGVVDIGSRRNGAEG